jgi:hypothetical protein
MHRLICKRTLAKDIRDFAFCRGKMYFDSRRTIYLNYRETKASQRRCLSVASPTRQRRARRKTLV